MAAPPGFEPEISASKADVLPLHYGAIYKKCNLEKTSVSILKSGHKAVKAR